MNALLGMPVRFSPHLPAGKALVMTNAFGPPTAYYRHWSEFALHAMSAEWHPHGDRCPTWVDSECRCMLGEEA